MSEKENDSVIAKLLSYSVGCGNISMESIPDNIRRMIKRNNVTADHHYKIFQGRGKDKRWFTYVKTGSGRKLIAKQTEENLLDYLENYYLGHKQELCLESVFPEWIEYKLTTNRSNSVHRIETDYKKFFQNEDLSKDLITKPLKVITVLDLKKWSYSLIQKYDMTHKAYSNIFTIWRQIFDFVISDDRLERQNPCNMFKIPANRFRKEIRKAPSTQTFTKAEVRAVISLACHLAKEKNDVVYLGIPMLLYTGTRPGECLALTFEDFHYENNTVTINKSLMVNDRKKEDGHWEKRSYKIEPLLKGNADARNVIVTDGCFEILEEIKQMHLRNGQKAEGLLFSVITPNNLEMKLYRICDSLGIKRHSPNKGRKTFLSILANTPGVSIDFVRSQAGHTTSKTTLDHYIYDNVESETELSLMKEAFHDLKPVINTKTV